MAAMAVNVADAQAQDLTVSDTENSGCTSHAPSYDGEDEPIPTIVLEKEGTILSMHLINVVSNCATLDFDVKSTLEEGIEGAPCSLTVWVNAVTGEEVADCICTFNVSFTIRDLESNTFYLKCWWYEGLVELTEGESLVLQDVKEDVSIDGLNYTLRKAFRRAMVATNKEAGEALIPSELSYEGQTYTVTSIYHDAFRDNTALTKVTFPQTISSMDFGEPGAFGRNPFIGCTALEWVEVEEGNPVLCAVDGVLFDKEKTKLYTYPAAATRTSYSVPESVTWIEGNAFAHNQHLVSVVLPDQATALGASAFYGCTNLEEVKLPSALTTMAGYLFTNCEHLKSITIPEGVTYLGGHLFSGCNSLTEVTMPESVESAHYAVFENCRSLERVTLSPKLDLINFEMFLNCSNLKEIEIPEGVGKVRAYAFQNCSSLKKLDLPEQVEYIGECTFSGCKMDSLLIRGILKPNAITEWLFDGLNTQTKIFVQPSEVEKIKKIYKGPVYPLTDEMNGISDIVGREDDPTERFDLQGRRIPGEPSRGIFIQNGQKRVAK